jgi:hypothetical protein
MMATQNSTKFILHLNFSAKIVNRRIILIVAEYGQE